MNNKKIFTISNDYLFKVIMNDRKIRKYIFKICFDKDIDIEKISNVELIKRYNKDVKEYEKMKEEEENLGLMEIKLGKAEERGKTKGINIGEKRGEIKGIQKNTMELAKRMLKEGATTDFVSKVTGLSKKVFMTMI